MSVDCDIAVNCLPRCEVMDPIKTLFVIICFQRLSLDMELFEELKHFSSSSNKFASLEATLVQTTTHLLNDLVTHRSEV